MRKLVLVRALTGIEGDVLMHLKFEYMLYLPDLPNFISACHNVAETMVGAVVIIWGSEY